MVEAEQQMQRVLASHSLADLAARVASKAPQSLPREIEGWFATCKAGRSRASTRKHNPGVK